MRLRATGVALDEGQTFAEYVMVLTLVALAVAASVKLTGTSIVSLYGQIQAGVDALVP